MVQSLGGSRAESIAVLGRQEGKSEDFVREMRVCRRGEWTLACSAVAEGRSKRRKWPSP